MTTMTGGALNIHGVVFQLLQTIRWAGKLRVEAGGKRESARITAEPRAGDVEIRWPARRVVQQMKSRTTGEAWSLHDVIREVMPDLYLATAAHALEQERFELVIDERHDDWSAFEAFLRELALQAVPARPVDALDDQKKIRFSFNRTYTRRELFRHVVRTLRKSSEIANNETELGTERRTWRLLANFHVVVSPPSSALHEELRSLVRSYGIAEDQVGATVNALLGAVAVRASKSETFSPADFLAEAGLHGIPLTDWNRLGAAARQQLARDIRRHTTYSSAASVRSPLEPRTSARLRIITGESGSGKTWSAAALGESLAARDDGSLVVLVRSAASVDTLLRKAADRIAVDLLGWQRDWPLEALVRRLRETFGELPDPWLTIIADELPLKVINDVAAEPLDEWGLQVITTAAPPVADAASALARVPADVITIPDFTADELQAFLRAHDIEGPFSRAFLAVLRRPIVAGIYASERGTKEVSSEEAVYDLYWQRLRYEREQPLHPSDVQIVLRLAREIAEGKSARWTRAEIAAAMSDEARGRLEAVGWLKRDPDDGASFWHDRLAAWAVAEAIVADVRAGRFTMTELAARLAKIAGDAWSRGAPTLKETPTDVLWLLFNRTPRPIDDTQAAELFQQLESAELYAGIVPQLGSGAMEAVIRRMTLPGELPPLYLPSVAKGLAQAAGADDAAVSLTLRLLRSSHAASARVGVLVAALRPNATLLDDLWHVHEQAAQAYERVRAEEQPIEGEARALYWRRRLEAMTALQRSSDAIRRSVVLDPGWLRRRVIAGGDLSQVPSLIAFVGGEEGRSLWLELEDVLLADDKLAERCTDCIRLYRDGAETHRLQVWFERGGLLQARAFAALVHVDADAAVARIGDADLDQLSMSRRWWVPWLFAVRGAEVTRELIDRLQKDASAALAVGEIFYTLTSYLDGELAAALLDAIERLLHDIADPMPVVVRMRMVLEILATAPAPAVELAVRQRRGGALHLRLIDVVIDAVREPTAYHSVEVDSVWRLMRRIGGEENCRFVEAMLESLWAVQPDWALVCDTPAIRAKLAALFGGPVVDANAVTAGRALAALGDRTTIVETVLKCDADRIEPHVPSFLSTHPPAGDDVLAPALAELESDDEQGAARGIAAIGFSGRRDLLPRVVAAARRAPVGSRLRAQAIYALADLAVAGDDVPADLITLDLWQSHRRFVERICLTAATESALATYETFVESAPEDDLARLDAWALLLTDSERGRRAATRLWEGASKLPIQWWRHDWFDITRYIDSPEVREWFLTNAFVASPNQALAAEALARYAPEVAFSAAEQALRSGDAVAPFALMAIDAARATGVLLAEMRRANGTAFREAIARALRGAGDRARIVEGIVVMISDHDRETKAAGLHLAGWIDGVPYELLATALFDDGGLRVQQAAADALTRRRAHDAVSATLATLDPADLPRALSALEAIVSSVNPFLLARRDDPLALAAVTEHVPVLHWLTERALQIAVRQADDEARSRDREREWL